MSTPHDHHRTQPTQSPELELDAGRSVTCDEAATISRRTVLGGLAASAIAGRALAAAPPGRPMPVAAINQMRIEVSDPDRSVKWYQRLFGMPIIARRAKTIALQVGDGPQTLTISPTTGGRPGIAHMGLAVADFEPRRMLKHLNDHGVATVRESTVDLGPRQARLELRRSKSEAPTSGTPELFFRDPDGIAVQLQHPAYRGGAGPLGDKRAKPPRPPAGKGLLRIRDYNHFTVFANDQLQSVAFYRRVFGMPIDTYQGSMPLLRIGAGNQFLAFVGAGGRPGFRPFIHHACFTVNRFDPDRVFRSLADHGIIRRTSRRGPVKPLESYVTMRMPDRGGAPRGTPELYFTDPDGILLQIQDVRYSGGSGYLGDKRGKGPPVSDSK